MAITIAGLGSGKTEFFTLALMDRLKTAKRIVLQTGRIEAADYFAQNGIAFETLDSLYEAADDFDSLNDAICTHVLNGGDALFCVLGTPYENTAVRTILDAAAKKDIAVEVLPGIALSDEALCAAASSFGVRENNGTVKLAASQIEGISADTDSVVCITEIDTPYKAGTVKNELARLYGDEKEIVIYSKNKAVNARLFELDRLSSYDYNTAVIVYPENLTEKARYTFYDLIRIMDILRGDDGCPWDKEQTHESLKQYLLEETYEVLEAVDEKDPDKLYDELGDVLLQVVFHAKIAKSAGEFEAEDITSAICKKMISRHTHIFGSAKAETAKDVLKNWEAIKKEEKGQDTYTEVLRDIPKSLPALMRSFKVQKKAAHVGFDWDNPQGALDKIKEETVELQQEYDLNDLDRMGKEAGDLLFAMTNLCRKLNVQPEIALNATTEKFITRFEYIEKSALQAGKNLKDLSLQQMDEYWNEAKRKGL